VIKITRNLSHDNRSPERDLNPGTPEYEARLLTTRRRHCHTLYSFLDFIMTDMPVCVLQYTNFSLNRRILIKRRPVVMNMPQHATNTLALIKECNGSQRLRSLILQDGHCCFSYRWGETTSLNVSELRPPRGLLFIPLEIYEYGQPWWSVNVDRGKLLIRPPELPDNHTSRVI
jgi:hypothetical protein